MWTCKNCSSEVEDNFDICWNCSNDKEGTMTTFNRLKENPNKNQENITIHKIKESFVLSHPEKIIKAGKSLKSVVNAIVIIIIISLFVIGLSLAEVVTSGIYTFAGILILLCNLKIIFEINNAGDELENSVTTIEKP